MVAMWKRLAVRCPYFSLRGKALGAAFCQEMQKNRALQSEAGKPGEAFDSTSGSRPFIAFVLEKTIMFLRVIDFLKLRVKGGPGSGKGTQCSKIAEEFGFAHLSAGDLLRKEILSNSENGVMISNIIKEGQIVPSEITVGLIQGAIESAKSDKILIDGFPRSDDNRIAFEKIVGVEPNLVLYFDCPEEEMVKRVLSRNQGRVDDNIETLKKRLNVFNELNLPVVNYYQAKNKVRPINAVGTEEQVFEKVRPIIANLVPNHR